jgi:hypothetical protein
MELHQGGDAFDWFLLSRSQLKLGNHEAAQHWYRRALSGFDQPLGFETFSHPVQLRELREDAEAP